MGLARYHRWSRSPIDRLLEGVWRRAERIKVALGPCIKPCCYAVSEELYQRFRDEIGPQAVGRTRSGRPALDLAGANTAFFVAAGVPESAIEVSPICTACRTDLFFSHRAERGNTGRFAAVVGLL